MPPNFSTVSIYLSTHFSFDYNKLHSLSVLVLFSSTYYVSPFQRFPLSSLYVPNTLLYFPIPMAETHSQYSQSPTPIFAPITTKPCDNHPHDQVAGFDWMVLAAAILCAFVCALGLNTMLQCVFQCFSRVLTEPMQWISSRRLNSGIKKKEIIAFPTSIYSHSGSGSDSGSPSSSASSCVICLAEFSNGDQIRFLPKCNHHFHVVCIDKWLLSHSSCPTCRHITQI